MQIQNNHWVIKLIGITIVKLLEAKWRGAGSSFTRVPPLSSESNIWRVDSAPSRVSVPKFGYKLHICTGIDTSVVLEETSGVDAS